MLLYWPYSLKNLLKATHNRTEIMNMTATQNSHQDHDIREEISYIAGLNQSHVRQIMDYSKAFLDKVFHWTEAHTKKSAVMWCITSMYWLFLPTVATAA